MGTERPDHEETGRVSPTAPASKSASVNVWKMLEQTSGVPERLREGIQQLEDGETVSMSDLRDEIDDPS